MTSGPNDPKRKRAFFMANALTQFTISEAIPGYWRVTFSNPPINLEDPDTILELQELVGRIEADDALRVVVLDSAHPDFFVNHYDVSRAAETPVAPGPTGLPAFIDTTTRLTNSPVVTIASIRGRTRGGGAELAAACDMRFASLERAIFGQPEVGAGMLPGGGGIERLPLLVGRARALEIILGSDDFDAATAAAYGWINCALPDAELDDFVVSRVRSGSFENASEVVRSALRSMEREEQEFQEKLQALRAAIDEGDASGWATGDVFARIRKKLNFPPRTRS